MLCRFFQVYSFVSDRFRAVVQVHHSHHSRRAGDCRFVLFCFHSCVGQDFTTQDVKGLGEARALEKIVRFHILATHYAVSGSFPH